MPLRHKLPDAKHESALNIYLWTAAGSAAPPVPLGWLWGRLVTSSSRNRSAAEPAAVHGENIFRNRLKP